eukprot:1180926-Prorocentrum_minimum.AAC.3
MLPSPYLNTSLSTTSSAPSTHPRSILTYPHPFCGGKPARGVPQAQGGSQGLQRGGAVPHPHLLLLLHPLPRPRFRLCGGGRRGRPLHHLHAAKRARGARERARPEHGARRRGDGEARRRRGRRGNHRAAAVPARGHLRQRLLRAGRGAPAQQVTKRDPKGPRGTQRDTLNPSPYKPSPSVPPSPPLPTAGRFATEENAREPP